ncbi:MAG: sigma-70 family RNA polymerase sigma factor [Gammaproteobacteria bacterium]|nr:sigma-70 family RNA polymerase sigma factor [Gammaproteobacteria bacterium]
MADGDLTQLLAEASSGDARAQSRLLEEVYHELRKLAESQMRRERSGHTLQATALVNEAYLRLAGNQGEWQNRRHFFGAAAEAMRRILIEHARRRDAEKRGGGLERVTLEGLEIPGGQDSINLLELDEALNALAEQNPRLRETVMLRYFTGLSIEETAEVLDISPASVKRDWTYARAWLFEYMANE